MVEIMSGIYEIDLHNPNGGTARVSAFLIPGNESERSLLIDAGYLNEESREHLMTAIETLGIRYDQLDVVITHKHHDHCGQALMLAKRGAAVYMNQLEDRHRYDCLTFSHSNSALAEQFNVLRTVGITAEKEPEVWNKYMEVNDRIEQRQEWLFTVEDFPYTGLRDDQVFACGSYQFEVLPLKGHTFGQVGLFDRVNKVVFTADQVINGIVPIVGTTHRDEHLLSCYFDSLAMLKNRFPGYRIQPSHNGLIEHPDQVIDEIVRSYIKKLESIKKLLEQSREPLTVKQIACMTYGIKQIPPDDGEFIKLKMVISKTFSCLEYLYDEGLIVRSDEDGMLIWERKR